MDIILDSLYLQNFATFENQTIKFQPSFNVIIGETGSGKSIIFDALQLILHKRADKKFIRKEKSFATIEAVFSVQNKKVAKFFNQLGHPFEDGQIVIKRVLYREGGTKTYLNHQVCSFNTLLKFSERFVDLVGQFENQKLLSENYQLFLLDVFASLQSEVKAYNILYKNLIETETELSTLEHDEITRAQRLDYLQFQINEIEKVNPTVEEEQKLIAEKATYHTFRRKKEIFEKVLYFLADSPNSNVLSQLKAALTESKQDPSLFDGPIIEQMEECHNTLEDLAFTLSHKSNKVESEINIDDVLDRLDKLQKLKRKFGPTIEDVCQHYKSFTAELESLNSLESKRNILIAKIEQLRNQATTMGKALHHQREQASIKLSKKLTKNIQQLMMKGATLKFNIKAVDGLGPYGLSQLEFIAETNPGEGFYRVKDIASGGELSRILLCLRHLIAASDSISIFLFDEIDTGIGGETALSIGKMLSTVAKGSQVLAITHLPQLAHFADQLIHVSKKAIKSESEMRTLSFIKEYSGKNKIEQIKMMVPKAYQ